MKKKKQHRSHAETKACSHSWEREIRGSTRQLSKLYFFAVKSTLTCNDVTMKPLLSPGPKPHLTAAFAPTSAHVSCCSWYLIGWISLTAALDIYCDWNIAGNWIWAVQWEVKCSYHTIRRSTANYELNRLHALRGERYWGTHKDLLPVLSVKYLKVLAPWGVFSFLMSCHI